MRRTGAMVASVCLAAGFFCFGATGTASAVDYNVDDIFVTAGLGPQIWLQPHTTNTSNSVARDIEVSTLPGYLKVVDHKGRIFPWLPCYTPADAAAADPYRTALCPMSPTTLPFFVLGPKNDKITIHETGAATVYVFGEAGNDTIISDEPADGSVSVMNFRSRAGNDRLVGGPGNDHLSGGSDSDQLVGAGGQDSAFYGVDDDPFSALAVPPVPTFPLSPDTHSPTITADNDGAPNDDGNSQDGNVGHRDTISADVEQITGTTGNDTLTGNANPNILDGGGGNDTLRGGEGGDVLKGDAGDDLEWGEGGDDTFGFDGRANNGLLTADLGADTFYGGPGTDTAWYESRTAAVSVSNEGSANDGNADDDNPLVAGDQRDRIVGDVENLQGGKGNDTMIGNPSSNTFRGGDGHDVIVGNAGNDTSYGEKGNDILFDALFSCGSGNDTLDGGQDVDILSGQCGQDTIYARDPIPGQFAFWIDNVDCGDDIAGVPDSVPDRAQINGNVWYPEPAPDCEQLLP